MLPCPPCGELAFPLQSLSFLLHKLPAMVMELKKLTLQRLCSFCTLKIRAECSFRWSRLVTSNEKTIQEIVKWAWVLETIRSGFQFWLTLAVIVIVLTDITVDIYGRHCGLISWSHLLVTLAFVELRLGMVIETLAHITWFGPVSDSGLSLSKCWRSSSDPCHKQQAQKLCHVQSHCGWELVETEWRQMGLDREAGVRSYRTIRLLLRS